MVIIIVGLVLLIPTAYAGYIGAPYAPTRRRAIEHAFDLLAVGKGDVVVDLGAGDGKVLLAAAQHGAVAIGYELSPIMWLITWFRTITTPAITIRWRNFLRAKLSPKTTHVFMFLMPEHMAKLQRYITHQHLPHLKFVLSYSFPIPDLPALHVVETDKAGRIFVYAAEDFN